MKKITKATIKAFIKKNAENLFIKEESSFCGMVDGIEYINGNFKKVEFNNGINTAYTMGIEGAWFVGSSRDYFKAFENEYFIGYNIYNCCGSFYLAIKK